MLSVGCGVAQGTPCPEGLSLSLSVPLSPTVLEGESQRCQTFAFPTKSSQPWTLLLQDPVASSHLHRASRGWHMRTVTSGFAWPSPAHLAGPCSQSHVTSCPGTMLAR